MKKIILLTALDLGNASSDDHILINELKKYGYAVESKPWEKLIDNGEDLFIIRTTWNYTEHFDDFINCLSPIKNRLWNPLPLIKWNANKKYLLKLYNKGLNIMPLSLADSKTSLENSINQLGGDDFIAKPLISASAKGLIRFNRSQLPTLNSEMIIQKFYPEITQGEVSLVYFNGKYSYAVKKIPQPGEIRVQSEFGGKVVPYQPSSEDLTLACNILQEIPDKWLYARVDIVPDVGLIELECIEPDLFFSQNNQAAKLFAQAISEYI